MEAIIMELAIIKPMSDVVPGIAPQTTEQPYKCHVCKHVLYGTPPNPGDKPVCPDCGNVMKEMCPEDHVWCGHDVTTSIKYCHVCVEPVCPECGCHDVVQISRVTGYLQEVSGWNAGKQQELKDRTRYNPLGGAQ